MRPVWVMSVEPITGQARAPGPDPGLIPIREGVLATGVLEEMGMVVPPGALPMGIPSNPWNSGRGEVPAEVIGSVSKAVMAVVLFEFR